MQSLDVPASLDSLLNPGGTLGDFLCAVEWDFDADGDLDLVIGMSSSCYLLRNGPGTQPAPLDQPWGCFSDATNLFASLNWGTVPFNTLGLTALATGDIDGDGREDLVAASSATPGVFAITFSPSGAFVFSVPSLTGALGTGPFGAIWGVPALPGALITSLVLVDALGTQGQPGADGLPDIFACVSTSFTINMGVTTWYPGRALAAANGGPGMPFVDASPPTPAYGPPGPQSSGSSVSIADFNADGLLDIYLAAAPLIAPPLPGVPRLYRGDAVAGWIDDSASLNDPITGLPLVTDVFHSELIDADNDGDLDLVLATGVTTEVLLNNGALPLQFAAGPVLTAASPSRIWPVSIGVGDFDGDGLQDVLDPLGSLWLGSPVGLVQNNVLIASVVEPATQYSSDARMAGVPFDVDWDGDLDWLAVWEDPDFYNMAPPTPRVVLLEWMNITVQLDGKLRPSRTGGSTNYYSLNIASANMSMAVLPWLAVDLGPLPIRIPNFLGYGGSLGLDPATAVGIGPVGGLVLNQGIGAHTVNFAGVPSGTILFYQAVHLNPNNTVVGWWTNVLRLEVQP